MPPNATGIWWKNPAVIIALLAHAVVFLWLFQLEFTREEWNRVEAKSPDKYWKDRVQAMWEEKGPMGLIIWFFEKHGEARIYYRYARLTLNGNTDYWEKEKNYKPQVERSLPYRDIPLEYQPGALIVFIPPALFSTDYESYRFWLGVWLGILHTLNLFLCIHLIARKPFSPARMSRMLWWSLAFLFCLGGIAVARFDHLAVTFILLSILLFKTAMKKESGAAMKWFFAFGFVASMGVLTKIIPGLVIPAALLVLLILYRDSASWKACVYSLAGLTAGLVLFNCVFLGIFGKGYLESYTYHMDRGVQIESLYSGIILLAHTVSQFSIALDNSYGSYNLVSPFTAEAKLLSPILFFFLAALIAWRVWQSRFHKNINASTEFCSSNSVLVLTLIFLLAFILTNKVFSPQYMIWPAALIAGLVAVREDFQKIGWLFLLATGLTQAIYPHLYNFLTGFHPAMVMALNLRNAILIFILVSLIRNLPKLLSEGQEARSFSDI